MDVNIRGICRVCGRSVALLNDGRIGRHGNKANSTQWPPLHCSGWGQLPKEDS